MPSYRFSSAASRKFDSLIAEEMGLDPANVLLNSIKAERGTGLTHINEVRLSATVTKAVSLERFNELLKLAQVSEGVIVEEA